MQGWIQRGQLALQSNHLRGRNGQPLRAASGIQHLHAWLQTQQSDDDAGAVCFGKRIVQIYHPAQPGRARKRLAIGNEPPDQGHKDK
jgi:hypothetical protein